VIELTIKDRSLHLTEIPAGATVRLLGDGDTNTIKNQTADGDFELESPCYGRFMLLVLYTHGDYTATLFRQHFALVDPAGEKVATPDPNAIVPPKP